VADKYTAAQRSMIMQRVHKRDTLPERRVRSLLHRLGLRFRLHDSTLPGCPDIVMPRHRKIILVHGCFWHGHRGCRRAARPTSNVEFWDGKIDRTMGRDRRNLRKLRSLGWKVLVLWECRLGDTERLLKRLDRFVQGA
jgi:DNA mismatch endonuclease (patch repair protein)